MLNENSNNLRHYKNQKGETVRQKFTTFGKLHLESFDNDSYDYLNNEQLIENEESINVNKNLSQVKFLGDPLINNSDKLRHVSKNITSNTKYRAIEIVSKLKLENDFETDMDNDCQYNSYDNDLPSNDRIHN